MLSWSKDIVSDLYILGSETSVSKIPAQLFSLCLYFFLSLYTPLFSSVGTQSGLHSPLSSILSWEVSYAESGWLVQGYPTNAHGRVEIQTWVSRILVHLTPLYHAVFLCVQRVDISCWSLENGQSKATPQLSQCRIKYLFNLSYDITGPLTSNWLKIVRNSTFQTFF